MVMRGPTNARGFALVDAIVGGILLSLVLVTMLSLTGRSVADQRKGEQIADAARLADEQLALVVALGPETYPSVIGTRGECDEPFENYRYETTLDTMRGQQDLYRATVEIVWDAPGNRERSVVVETLVSVRRGETVEGERQPLTTIQRTSDEAEQ